MVNDVEDDDSCPKPVGRSSVFYYGVGHMLNDITAACWFTYLLLFLTEIGLSPRDAAIVMLAGQIADGFATVFAGELVANLSLYAVALVVFSTTKSTTHSDIENQYHWIAYTSIFIGCCFVGVFHLGTKEPRLKIRVHGTSYARISWAYWFKKVLYYQVGLVYMLTRLAQNVSQAYLAFYVIEDMRMAKSAKALVPAIIYISSFIVSIIMQEMYWTGQRLKAYYCAGGVLWVFCGASILFLPQSLSAFMYVISVFIGVANALMTVTGVSMQSVLVGSDLNGCAFVYGSLSFLDKVSCGLAVFVLQSFQSSSPRSQETLSTEYISVTRYGLGLLPAVCSLTGMAITYTMKLQTPHSKPLMEPLLE
ncbi:hypothetical protein POTOM_032599 [Populus tomentosa]|uniref:Major facilitator superfamily domain-containing protein 12-like n=1 Tax=Populus tomentosa TaxID=118781 RepID=A0A8X8CPY2_POPTO|nr:hypothetical protein POTOM_032599 [Populus tomentosa]